MPIVSHVKLVTDVPAIAPAIIERWKTHLKDQAERINTNRKAKIPDATAFNDKLATTAIQGWRNLLNPTFRSRAGLSAADIRASHQANLSEAFKKYNDQLDYAFATVDGVPAKRFKDLVDRAAEEFGEGIAAKALVFAGYRAAGLGLAPIATKWLTGDVTTEGHLRAGDEILEGGPYLVSSEAKKPGLKAMLNQRLIQAGIIILKAGLDSTVISTQNQLTAEQVQGFVDPALDLIPFVAAGDSKVDYIVVDGRLYLEIKVSKM